MAMVTLDALQSRLQEHVRLAESGETVLIVRAGRVIAEIRPPQPAMRGVGLHEASATLYEDEGLSVHEQADTWEQRGVREGWLRPPTIKDGSPPPRTPVEGLTFEQLLIDLERDREDR